MVSESPDTPEPSGQDAASADTAEGNNVHPGPREGGGAGGMATRELAERVHIPSPGRRD